MRCSIISGLPTFELPALLAPPSCGLSHCVAVKAAVGKGPQKKAPAASNDA